MAVVVTCEHCGQPVPPRNDYYCSRRCSNAAKRGQQIGSKAEQYDELEWLLSQGVEDFEAIARCGIPTADAAYQWAIRHQRLRLAAMLRAAYNVERAAMHRRQRATR